MTDKTQTAIDRMMEKGIDWLAEAIEYGQYALALWYEWFEFSGNPICDDDYGNTYCFFCGGLFFGGDEWKHEDDCIFIRAKLLIGKARSQGIRPIVRHIDKNSEIESNSP